MIALNTLVDPGVLYKGVFEQRHPVIVIENKVGYGKFVQPPSLPNCEVEVSQQQFPTVRIRPKSSTPTVTVVTYGGMTDIVLDCVPQLFRDWDIKCEVLVLSCINPIDYRSIMESVASSRGLVVVEEGVASVVSQVKLLRRYLRT